MKTTSTITVNGKNYQATEITCDVPACGRAIDPASEPIIVKQSSLTLVHPSGYTEMIHQSNERAGKFHYYCQDCLKKQAVPGQTPEELQNFDAAMQRRAADYPAPAPTTTSTSTTSTSSTPVQ